METFLLAPTRLREKEVMSRRPPMFAIAARRVAFLVLLVTVAPEVRATPVAGFVEEWTGATTHGWGGGAVYDNPGTGGYLKAGDGFLRVSTPLGGNLGTTSPSPEYVGDWVAAGITRVGVWLNDVNGNEALEIHFSLGRAQVNFWQYDVGFLPPENAWGQFVVDLSSPANWTQTFGSASFTEALQQVDRVHWRHDVAPYAQFPDPITADVGIDHMILTDGVVGMAPRPPELRSPVELSPPSPNPSRGPVTLTLRSPDRSAVRLEVIDVGGRSVRRAELPAGVAGVRVWLWDGRDDRGDPAPPGLYRVRAQSAAGGTSRSIVRVR
jgi:hypothetical protein